MSFIILEAPVDEYDKMAQGFTPQELAKRGITDVRPDSIARSDPHVYMRARQMSEAGTYEKFFVLVPHQRPDDPRLGQRAREGDRGRQRQAGGDREDPRLGQDHGEAGGAQPLLALLPRPLQGGRHARRHQQGLHARRAPRAGARGETRSAFMVAPSLDKRPVAEPEKLAVALLASLPGYKEVKPGEPHDIKIGDLDGVEVSAHAVDEDDNTPVHLYQAMLLGKDGGYFRLIGIATDGGCRRASSPSSPRSPRASRCCRERVGCGLTGVGAPSHMNGPWRAVSSAVEHTLHTRGVIGSIPIPPTTRINDLARRKDWALSRALAPCRGRVASRGSGPASRWSSGPAARVLHCNISTIGPFQCTLTIFQARVLNFFLTLARALLVGGVGNCTLTGLTAKRSI